MHRTPLTKLSSLSAFARHWRTVAPAFLLVLLAHGVWVVSTEDPREARSSIVLASPLFDSAGDSLLSKASDHSARGTDTEGVPSGKGPLVACTKDQESGVPRIETSAVAATADSALECATSSADALAARIRAEARKAIHEERASLAIRRSRLRWEVLVASGALDRDRESAFLRAEFERVRSRLHAAEAMEDRLGALASTVDQGSVARVGESRVLSVSRGFLGLRWAIGVALAFGFAAAVALRLDQVDTRIRSADEARTRLHLPVLASVPPIPSSQGSSGPIPTEQLPIEAVESYATFAAKLRNQLGALDLRSVAFTGGAAQEGRSSTVVHVGRALAALGARVLLVDCAFDRPRLHEVFALDEGPGIFDFLTSIPLTAGSQARGPLASGIGAFIEERASSLARPTRLDRLHVVTCGAVPRAGPAALPTVFLRPVVLRLARDHDVVLADTPPTDSPWPVAEICAGFDATVLVLRAWVTERASAMEAVDELREARIQVLGMIVHAVRSHSGEGLPPGDSAHVLEFPQRRMVTA